MNEVVGRSPQEIAKRLAEDFDRVSKELKGLADMPARLFAVVMDVQGILEGLAEGYITTGQQRLADGLIEIVVSVDPGHPLCEANLYLYETAKAGLSIEGQQLGITKQLGHGDKMRGR